MPVELGALGFPVCKKLGLHGNPLRFPSQPVGQLIGLSNALFISIRQRASLNRPDKTGNVLCVFLALLPRATDQRPPQFSPLPGLFQILLGGDLLLQPQALNFPFSLESLGFYISNSGLELRQRPFSIRKSLFKPIDGFQRGQRKLLQFFQCPGPQGLFRQGPFQGFPQAPDFRALRHIVLLEGCVFPCPAHSVREGIYRFGGLQTSQFLLETPFEAGEF